MTLTERFQELRKRKLVRAIIVVTAPIWFPCAVVLALVFYVLLVLLWLIGTPIAKAVRYIQYGDTETKFFDELEEAINFF